MARNPPARTTVVPPHVTRRPRGERFFSSSFLFVKWRPSWFWNRVAAQCVQGIGARRQKALGSPTPLCGIRAGMRTTTQPGCLGWGAFARDPPTPPSWRGFTKLIAWGKALALGVLGSDRSRTGWSQSSIRGSHALMGERGIDHGRPPDRPRGGPIMAPVTY